LRGAMKSGKMQPQDVSLIIVYTLAKALAISPLEIYKMPQSLVMDMLMLVNIQNEIEAEEMKKASKSK
tara:strand:+ start:312 stop:515 length:204 start_codon:yes stop_codon:yes gene_type:complete